jgi:hypothetical protein
MEPSPTTPEVRRPRWAIDLRLEGLLGREVRVAAEAFFPIRWDGEVLPVPIPVGDLILPDNSRAGSVPVFFEGRLRQFERRIGVVYVTLDAPVLPPSSAEGRVLVRGVPAVLVRGPALVRLAFPFRVEPLPTDEPNYWEDLRFPKAQLHLPFGEHGSQ